MGKQFCVCGHHKDLHKPCNVSGKMVEENCTGLTYVRTADSIYPEEIGKFHPEQGAVYCGCMKLTYEDNNDKIRMWM